MNRVVIGSKFDNSEVKSDRKAYAQKFHREDIIETQKSYQV